MVAASAPPPKGTGSIRPRLIVRLRRSRFRRIAEHRSVGADRQWQSAGDARVSSIARIPAAEIENRVVDALGKIEPRPGSGGRFVVDDQLEKPPTSTDRREPTCDRRAEIRALIDRVTVESTMIRIALSVHAAEDGEAQPVRQMGGKSPAHMIAPLQVKLASIETLQARNEPAQVR